MITTSALCTLLSILLVSPDKWHSPLLLSIPSPSWGWCRIMQTDCIPNLREALESIYPRLHAVSMPRQALMSAFGDCSERLTF